MLSIIISRFVVLLGGALYPAYRSYKTVKTKNVRDYVKWMMYWIVFAIFICLEDFVDMFFSFWFPFYYETKIIFVVWLLSPYTTGASFLYRKLIHPYLVKHERDIDNYLDKAKIGGYHTFTNFLAKSVAQLKEMIIEATHHGQEQFVLQMKKSSLFTDVDLDTLVDQEDSKFNNSADVTRANNEVDASKPSDANISPENIASSSSSKVLSVVEPIRSRSDNDYRYYSNYDTYSSTRHRPFQPRMTTRFGVSSGSGSGSRLYDSRSYR